MTFGLSQRMLNVVLSGWIDAAIVQHVQEHQKYFFNFPTYPAAVNP